MSKLTSTDKRKIKLHFLASKQAYKDAIQGAGSSIVNVFLGTKKAVDGADEYLGAKIGEQKNKITNTARRYILRTLIGLSVVGYTGDKVSEYFSYKNEKNKQEEMEKQYVEHAKQKGFVSTGNSFEQGGKRYDEFTYVVTAEDIEQAKKQNVHVATIIADKFDKQDLENGNKYQNTGYSNVYDKNDIDGKDLDVEIGEKLFFKARKIKKVERGRNKISLKKKPMDLGYHEIYSEKKIKLNNFPKIGVGYDYDGRIVRSLRRKSITDIVEDKYDIPRGLLMAMMAQEGYGDPTMPNSIGDGGLGLIHIQGKNASDYGLKTLPRYNEGMRDFKHGKEIIKVLKKEHYNMEKLIKYDDRFHPVLAVDVAARYLKNYCYKKSDGKDAWIIALKRYSGRGLSDYAYPVLQYWATINSYTGEKIPFFTNGINSVADGKSSVKWNGRTLVNTKDMIKKLNNAVDSISVDIGDKKQQSFSEYLDYFSDLCENYELEKYRNN